MTSILSRKGLLLFTLYNMPLHHLTSLIHTKTSTLLFPSKPSATISPSPIFRRLQSFFTVRMIEDCGGIFGLVSPWPWIVGRLLHSPNIVRNFGWQWWEFWHHDPKGTKSMCQGVAQLYHQVSTDRGMPGLFVILRFLFRNFLNLQSLPIQDHR